MFLDRRGEVILGLSDLDLGWLVGFLKGEGTFQLQTPGKTGRYAYPSIRAFQVQKWPIEKCQDLMGGSINLRRARPEPGKNSQPCWLWYRNGRDVEEILVALQPLFSPRRQEQIQRVLDGTKRGAAPKLSFEIAEEIRASNETGTALAAKYGVTQSLVSMIRLGKIWKREPEWRVPTTRGNARPGRGKSKTSEALA